MKGYFYDHVQTDYYPISHYYGNFRHDAFRLWGGERHDRRNDRK